MTSKELFLQRMICQQARRFICDQNLIRYLTLGSAVTFSSFNRRYNGKDAAITKQMLIANALYELGKTNMS
jgi:hypothetical protein